MNDSTSGYTTVPNWMLAADDVSAHMILVYAALGTWTNREGTAWPAVPSIAQRAKISPSSVKRALRDLEAMGLVETVQRRLQTGGQTSSVYRLHTTTPLGQSDLPPRSEGQGGEVRLTYEQAPLEQPPADAGGETTRKRATRIPDPFIVTAEMWEWCKGKGFDPAWAREQTERFVDYWRGIPGQRGTKLDWPGTWRNWLRRSWDDRRAPSTGSSARETPDERFRRLMAQAEAMDTQGGAERLAVEA
ncbi:helix-turn-helix DNA binding domain protein [Microbacterium phage Gingerbug]|nr:helix-turn-helix DNA binding domain protein [Microbacterium phage Gingerbug]